MDPNANLKEQRELIADIRAAVGSAYEEKYGSLSDYIQVWFLLQNLAGTLTYHSMVISN